MILTDSHVHTTFSTDGRATMEAMAERAEQLGFSSLCFTDHMDYYFSPSDYVVIDPPLDERQPPGFQFDPALYWEVFTRLKGGFPVRCGVELGLRPDAADKNQVLLEAHPWDFAIGSVHIVDGTDPYNSEYWDGVEEEKGVLRFFEATLACVGMGMDFDVLGHMDYVFRYAPSKNRLFTYAKWGDVLDEVMRSLIQRGKGIEINTSGLRSDLGVPHPHPDVIRRYRELGGEILTVGSDAHYVEHLGYRFEETAEWLKSVGFRYYTVYQGRKAEFLPL